MRDEDKQRIRARLRRIAGQVRALEETVGQDDSSKFIGQLEAVIAAGKASLRFYVERKMLSGEELSGEDRQLLARLVEKFTD